jgi:hypothetical protein
LTASLIWIKVLGTGPDPDRPTISQLHYEVCMNAPFPVRGGNCSPHGYVSDAQNVLRAASPAAPRPIEEQGLHDLARFLAHRPGATYILIGEDRDGPCADCGPDVASALDLAICLAHDGDFFGPHPSRHPREYEAEIVGRWRETAAEIEERLAVLKNQRTTTYLLAWAIVGSCYARAASSPALPKDLVRVRLSQFLQRAVREQLGGQETTVLGWSR